MNLKLQVSLRELLYHFDYDHPIGLREETEEEKENVRRVKAGNRQEAQEDVCYEIDKLVRAGADPRECFEFPLCLAARAGLLIVVKHLIKKHKADDSVYQYDALNDAIENGHLDVARYLVKRMKSRLVQVEKKQTPTF